MAAAELGLSAVKQVHNTLGKASIGGGGAVNAALVAVDFVIDCYHYKKGKITGKQLAKNTTRNALCAAASTGAGYLGTMAVGLLATAAGASLTGVGVVIGAACVSVAAGILAWKGVSCLWGKLFG